MTTFPAAPLRLASAHLPTWHRASKKKDAVPGANVVFQVIMATVGWNQYPLGQLIYHQKRWFTWEKLRINGDGDIMIFFGGKPPGEWLVNGDLASFWLVPRKFNSDFVPFLWCHSNKAFREIVFPQMMSVGWVKNETLTGVTSPQKNLNINLNIGCKHHFATKPSQAVSWVMNHTFIGQIYKQSPIRLTYTLPVTKHWWHCFAIKDWDLIHSTRKHYDSTPFGNQTWQWNISHL